MTGMPRRRSVTIDAFPSSANDHKGRAIVAIDVIRATTFAITAVAAGRRCIVARDVDHAFEIRRRLPEALLAGETAGETPAGFDLTNSPAQLVERTDTHRPVVMVSSSGTHLMLAAQEAAASAYVACLRNVSAMSELLIEHEDDVVLIGAGSRGEFREEDQLGCAWIGANLLAAGFEPTDDRTRAVIDRWSGATVRDLEGGKSVTYLRRSGQMLDFDFIASHLDDLDLVASIGSGEVTAPSVLEVAV